MISSHTIRHLSWLLLFTCLWPLGAYAGPRQTLNFNPDWRFIKEDPAGAQAPGFDDRKWAVVSLPHTYNDVDTFDNWSTPGHRGEQIQWGGRTWYRKTFDAPGAWKGKKVFIEFEAARQVAEVYLNGQLLGVSKTGFTPFGFDLTPYLHVGTRNVIAVMVDNRFMKDRIDPAAQAELAKRYGSADAGAAPAAQHADVNLRETQGEVNQGIPDRLEGLQADQIPWNNPHWHPAHGGLYRNVRLIVTDPLHITLPLYSFLATTGPYAYATSVSSASAQIGVEVPVQNGRASSLSVGLSVTVTEPDGHPVLGFSLTQEIPAGATATISGSGMLKNPRLWNPTIRTSIASSARFISGLARRPGAMKDSSTLSNCRSASGRRTGTRPRASSSTAITSSCMAGARSRPTSGRGWARRCRTGCSSTPWSR
jgi:beta-galactosidase